MLFKSQPEPDGDIDVVTARSMLRQWTIVRRALTVLLLAAVLDSIVSGAIGASAGASTMDGGVEDGFRTIFRMVMLFAGAGWGFLVVMWCSGVNDDLDFSCCGFLLGVLALVGAGTGVPVGPDLTWVMAVSGVAMIALTACARAAVSRQELADKAISDFHFRRCPMWISLV